MNQNIDEKGCILEISGGKCVTANKAKIYTDYQNMKIVNELNRSKVHFAKFANTSFFTFYTLFMLVKNNSECNSKKK